MKTHDIANAAGSAEISSADPRTRLVALERLIVYAREEAEQLKADVLVFCLDASLSVARTELEGQKTASKRTRRSTVSKSRH